MDINCNLNINSYICTTNNSKEKVLAKDKKKTIQKPKEVEEEINTNINEEEPEQEEINTNIKKEVHIYHL